MSYFGQLLDLVDLDVDNTEGLQYGRFCCPTSDEAFRRAWHQEQNELIEELGEEYLEFLGENGEDNDPERNDDDL